MQSPTKKTNCDKKRIKKHCKKLHNLGEIKHYFDRENNKSWVCLVPEGTKKGTIGILKGTTYKELLEILCLKDWDSLVPYSTLLVGLNVTLNNIKIPVKLEFDSLKQNNEEGTKIEEGVLSDNKNDSITVSSEKISTQKLVPSKKDYISYSELQEIIKELPLNKMYLEHEFLEITKCKKDQLR